VLIDGLRQNLVTLNGDVFLTGKEFYVSGEASGGGAGGNKQYGSLETIPSELVSGIDVIKNPNAAITEGGLGGTINLKTADPLQAQDGLSLPACSANRMRNGRTTRPRRHAGRVLQDQRPPCRQRQPHVQRFEDAHPGIPGRESQRMGHLEFGDASLHRPVDVRSESECGTISRAIVPPCGRQQAGVRRRRRIRDDHPLRFASWYSWVCVFKSLYVRLALTARRSLIL